MTGIVGLLVFSSGYIHAARRVVVLSETKPKAEDIRLIITT